MKKIAPVCALVLALGLAPNALARIGGVILSPSYSATTTLGDSGLDVEVERWGTGLIRYSVNVGIPSQLSPAGGCTAHLTAAEADHLGLVFQWSASDVAPQAFERRVPYASGDGTWASPVIVTNRGAVSAWVESYIADGHSAITLYEMDCFVTLTDEEAIVVGGFLMAAAAVAP